VPIRARLTAAFALAMVLVLVAAGLFVYLRLRSNLTEAVDAGLDARSTTVGAITDLGRRPLEDDEESFQQVVSPGGRVLATVGGARGPVLRPAEVRRAADDEVVLEREIPGIEGTARVLARPGLAAGEPVVLVVGQSLDDRDEALAGVVTSFAVGGALAVALAALIGYGLAATALRPVEAMRSRAERISLNGSDELLPLPAAGDEIRRLGETLNDMVERLRRSFERERRFVGDASHELRTPVAVLKTELEVALRSGDYGPSVREALVAAVEECDHLAQLAEDLLVIARATEGGLPVRHERLTVGALLREVGERFADRAAQQGSAIRVEAPDALTVHADALRLRQAVGNLVDNALRHGEGEVVLRASALDGGVAIDVADAGKGFPPDVAGRAFERFARSDAARASGGSGLGLAIVRAVAEAHGGAASIVPGAGATVRLWLPAERVRREEPAPARRS
jgi:two-component system, OmpR family, sensor kinase